MRDTDGPRIPIAARRSFRGPEGAVLGSCSCLCQVARVLKQTGTCLSSSFPNPKVYCVSCLGPLQAIYYFILIISSQKEFDFSIIECPIFKHLVLWAFWWLFLGEVSYISGIIAPEG